MRDQSSGMMPLGIYDDGQARWLDPDFGDGGCQVK